MIFYSLKKAWVMYVFQVKPSKNFRFILYFTRLFMMYSTVYMPTARFSPSFNFWILVLAENWFSQCFV